jgi:hypothetical protein
LTLALLSLDSNVMSVTTAAYAVPMLVANRSFITSDAYGEIRVTRGVTHVAPDSDLALRFPDCFTASGASSRGTRSTAIRMCADRPTLIAPGSPASESIESLQKRRAPWRLARVRHH